MKLQPYLFFEGRCEEALTFYRDALGAEILAMMRYRESPDPQSCPPGAEDKVMHATFRIGETELMASDGHAAGTPLFEGVALALTADSAEEAERLFKALEEGGAARMAMEKTFFAERFGMVDDKFGMSWMIVAGAAG